MRAYFGCPTTFFWSVFALLMLSFIRLADAAEWVAQPSLRLGLEYNDNPLLTTQPHESVHASTISPKLDLSVNSDIWQVRGSMQDERKRYTSNSNLDRDDQNYSLATSYHTERSAWQLTGVRSISSTLSEEQITPDTGLVEVPVTRDSHSISPSWVWQMSELTQLQLAYSLGGSSYVNGQRIGLLDYGTRTVSAQLASRIDPKNRVFFTVGHSIFNVPATSFESRSNMYQAGATRNFSDTLQGTLSAGLRKTSDVGNVQVCTVRLAGSPDCLLYGSVPQSSDHTSSVFSGSLMKKYETVQLDLSVNRSYDPSGLGTEVRTDSQTASLSKLFTARLKGKLSAGNYSYRSQTGGLADAKRDQRTFSTDLSWDWTRELNLDFRYQYRRFKRATEDQVATSNVVLLGLRYQWSEMAISR